MVVLRISKRTSSSVITVQSWSQRDGQFKLRVDPWTDTLTCFLSVGQGYSSRGVNDSNVENSLHRWLIETRKSLSGMSGMHLRGGSDSWNKQTSQIRPQGGSVQDTDIEAHLLPHAGVFILAPVKARQVIGQLSSELSVQLVHPLRELSGELDHQILGLRLQPQGLNAGSRSMILDNWQLDKETWQPWG